MILQDLIDYFRKQVQDTNPPYLWDDSECLLYAVDAQDEFVRRIGGISSVTVAASSDPSNLQLHDLAVTPGVATVTYSPYILRIRSLKLLNKNVPLDLMSESDISRYRTWDYGEWSPNFLSDIDVGQVTAAVFGMQDYTLRWYKVPDPATQLADTCRMHVYRLPYPRITTSEGALEIEDFHHLHLSSWMKHLAYMKEDAETYDEKLAAKNEEIFDAYCERAKGEKDRQRFKPRIVQFNSDFAGDRYW
jgi:hypothetical protein